MKTPCFAPPPNWQQMSADDLYRYLDRARLEFGDRVLLILTRSNRRHVQKLLKRIKKSGRSLPCSVRIEGHPHE